MKTYAVIVIETSRRVFHVQAEDGDEAVRTVEEQEPAKSESLDVSWTAECDGVAVAKGGAAC